MMIISKILIIPNIDFTTRYSNQFLFFLSFTSTILEVKKAYSLDPLYCIQQTLLYCAKPNTHTPSLPASSWQIQAIAISKKLSFDQTLFRKESSTLPRAGKLCHLLWNGCNVFSWCHLIPSPSCIWCIDVIFVLQTLQTKIFVVNVWQMKKYTIWRKILFLSQSKRSVMENLWILQLRNNNIFYEL